MKASAYDELCLSIPTHIDTSMDNTVYHLLSTMQASWEAAWCVGVSAPKGINNFWHDMDPYDQLNKSYCFYMAAVVGIVR